MTNETEMAGNQPDNSAVWLAEGVRTPFVKVDGSLSSYDAIGASTSD